MVISGAFYGFCRLKTRCLQITSQRGFFLQIYDFVVQKKVLQTNEEEKLKKNTVLLICKFGWLAQQNIDQVQRILRKACEWKDEFTFNNFKRGLFQSNLVWWLNVTTDDRQCMKLKVKRISEKCIYMYICIIN